MMKKPINTILRISKKEFVDKLEFDLEILKEIKKLWKKIDSDPKLEQFIRDLKEIKALESNKLVIFTESKETGDYIYESLIDEFPGQVMFYSSTGGGRTLIKNYCQITPSLVI